MQPTRDERRAAWSGSTAAVSQQARRPERLNHGEALAKKGVVVVTVADRLGSSGSWRIRG
jgi:hypothetical protein